MLTLRYESEFRGEPTLLILGDDGALETFASRLMAWSATRAPMSFISGDSVQLQGFAELTLLDSVPERTGLREVSSGRFAWHLSPSLASDFAKSVRGLTQTTHPSHAYLDAPDSEATVIVSKGEYM